jgi:predicted nicotinamide N-methyase
LKETTVVKTFSGAPYPAVTHSALQRRLLRNASHPARKTQADSLRLRSVEMVPEIHLFLAEDPVLLWARLEADAGSSLTTPFWATAWTGGQALARYILDNPALVAGKRVLDVASGSGLVAIAAAMAGATEVTANDIDGYAIAALLANANANGCRIAHDHRDLTEGDGGDAEVVLIGDCLYNVEVADRMLPFISRVTARGATVLIGDPGRGHAPDSMLETLETYHSPAMGADEYGQHEHSSVLTPVVAVPAV